MGLRTRKFRLLIDLRIERLNLGNFGQSKCVCLAIFELKIDFGPGYRIYYAKIGLNIILLLCAGSKRSQQSDIMKAKEYFKDFKKSRTI